MLNLIKILREIKVQQLKKLDLTNLAFPNYDEKPVDRKTITIGKNLIDGNHSVRRSPHLTVLSEDYLLTWEVVYRSGNYCSSLGSARLWNIKTGLIMPMNFNPVQKFLADTTLIEASLKTAMGGGVVSADTEAVIKTWIKQFLFITATLSSDVVVDDKAVSIRVKNTKATGVHPGVCQQIISFKITDKTGALIEEQSESLRATGVQYATIRAAWSLNNYQIAFCIGPSGNRGNTRKPEIIIWDLKKGARVKAIGFNKTPLRTFSDGRIAYIDAPDELKIFDLWQQKCLHSTKLPEQIRSFGIPSLDNFSVRTVIQPDDPNVLALVLRNNTLVFYDLNTAQCLRTLSDVDGAPVSRQADNTNDLLYVTYLKKESTSNPQASYTRVWDMQTWQCVAKLNHSLDTCYSPQTATVSYPYILLLDGRLSVLHEGGVDLWKFPTKPLTKQHIKAILNVLKDNQSVTTVRFSGLPVDDELVKSLADILQNSATITSVNLSNTKVTDLGANELLKALDRNKSLINLDLTNTAVSAILQMKIRTKLASRKAAKPNPIPRVPPVKALPKDGDGNTPLHLACIKNDAAEVARCLKQNPSAVNKGNKAGDTPLHLSLKFGPSLVVTKKLLQKGADSNITNFKFQTPLAVLVNPTAHPDVVAELLQNRCHWRMAYLELVIAACKNRYKGDFESRYFDQELLDTHVSRLTGYDVHMLMEQHKWTYLGHLNSIEGQYRRHTDELFTKFEGFWVDSFLPLRIRILFELIIKIEKQIFAANTIPKPSSVTLQKLKNELISELETLCASRDAQFVQLYMNNDKKCLQAHVLNIQGKIVALTTGGRSYCYYSGYLRHAVYINFNRQSISGETKYLPRLDNLGWWVSRGKHTKITKIRANKTGKPKTDNYYYPCGFNIPSDYFNNKPAFYLVNIVEAQFLADENKAYQRLYASNIPAFQLLPKVVLPSIWPAKLEQTVGNCVVKNHEIGLQIRWRAGDVSDSLYRWFREEEVKHIPLKSYRKNAKKKQPVKPPPAFAACAKKDEAAKNAYASQEAKLMETEVASGSELHCVVFEDNTAKFEALLSQSKLNIDITTPKQLYTPLHLAAFLGRKDMVTRLLQMDASLDAKTANGETPLSLAVLNNRVAVIDQLQEHEAQSECQTRKYTLLHLSVQRDAVSATSKLLKVGKIDINAKTSAGYTALHLAALNSNATMINLLLQHGAQTDITTYKGDTALTLAKLGRKPSVIAAFAIVKSKKPGLPPKDSVDDVSWFSLKQTVERQQKKINQLKAEIAKLNELVRHLGAGNISTNEHPDDSQSSHSVSSLRTFFS